MSEPRLADATLRDFFAGQAIAGILDAIGKQVAAQQSKIIGAVINPNINFSGIADDAYKLADAMMYHRQEVKP